jgi:hypothetical protein
MAEDPEIAERNRVGPRLSPEEVMRRITEIADASRANQSSETPKR